MIVNERRTTGPDVRTTYSGIAPELLVRTLLTSSSNDDKRQ
jgi:hypothetical protein